MGVIQCQRSRWGGMGRAVGQEGFLSCVLGITTEWRWSRKPLQGQPGEGRAGQALVGAPGTLSLFLSSMAGGGWTSTPLLGTAARPSLSGTWPLGSGGLVFAGGEFPGDLPKSTGGPWCVGRGGVLDNLMFSTLTPFFVFKVGVGAAAKSGYWVGPLSPRSSLPASCAVAGEVVASWFAEPSEGGRALDGSAGSAHLPLGCEHSHVTAWLDRHLQWEGPEWQTPRAWWACTLP